MGHYLYTKFRRSSYCDQ